MRDISYRVALGGIVSALCLVTMFLAGIIPALYILLPMVAGVLLMIISVEVSRGWALLTYLSVSLLSMIITFDKEAALIFILVFGHYPILREYIKKAKPKVMSWILKLVLFNISIISYFFVTVYILGLDQMLDEFDEFGRYGAYFMLGLANVLFLFYDLNLDSIYRIYIKRLAPKFRKKR
ncbi:MAG: hypothetical protein GXY08_06815 [Ruminococcus sp.]|nr:hypothetical protein [Ruminococcus sp.]